MLWNWNTIDACFISSDWHVRSKGAFAGTCIGVVLISITLESLRRGAREYDDYLLRNFQARVTSNSVSRPASDPAACSASEDGVVERTATFRPGPVQQLIRAVLHAATFGVAYILMLLAMYYNGYVIICIFVGAGVGKFLCDWTSKTIVIGRGSRVGGVGLQDKMGGRTIDEPTVCCG